MADSVKIDIPPGRFLLAYHDGEEARHVMINASGIPLPEVPTTAEMNRWVEESWRKVFRPALALLFAKQYAAALEATKREATRPREV